MVEIRSRYCAHKGRPIGLTTTGTECAGPSAVRDFNQWAQLMLAADPWAGRDIYTLRRSYAAVWWDQPVCDAHWQVELSYAQAEYDKRRRALTRWREASHARYEPVEHAPRPCDHCAETFIPARSDARYCSGRCRVAAHRAAKAGPDTNGLTPTGDTNDPGSGRTHAADS